jgi:hypothetical protein
MFLDLIKVLLHFALLKKRLLLEKRRHSVRPNERHGGS